MGLDLVLVGPNTNPPVAKILDFGKYKYQLEKEERKKKAHTKEQKVKEIRLSLKIGEHDLEVKAKRANEFLTDGNKVKVSLRLKGRENMFRQDGFALLKNFQEKTIGQFEEKPKILGNNIFVTLKKNHGTENKNS